MAATVAVALWPTAAASQSSDGDQKELTIWSADLSPELQIFGDEPTELGYPNVRNVWGYYRQLPIWAGSLSDDDFDWKGDTWTINVIASVGTGEAATIGFVSYDEFCLRLTSFKSTSGGIRSDPDVGTLTLYIDSSVGSAGTVRSLPFTQTSGSEVSTSKNGNAVRRHRTIHS